MTRLAALCVFSLGLGCSSFRPLDAIVCVSDAECPDGQLCFAEGCGDPGKGIVVEVQGALSGQYPRDFSLAAGTLGAVQDFDLGQPLTVSGEFQRDRSSASNPLDRTFYVDPVVVRAVGQSLLLPGITRTFETHFDRPERGSFEMKLGAGDFIVTAMPAERTIPPVSAAAKVESGGTLPVITFVFPAADGAPALTGQLIKKLDATLAPPEPVLLSAPYTALNKEVPTVDLQLFDVATNQPLSQRFPIASTTGEFAITMSPEARNQTSLVLVAAPREPGVAIPTKRFTIDAKTTSAVALQYGDFGEAADVTGTVVDSTGAPVVGAQVVMEGTVVGDGVFRSKIVETNGAGEFTVTSLGSKSDGSFQLTVAPPRGSPAAYTQRNVSVKVSRPAGATAAVATLSPARLSLTDRLIAQGTVRRPDGKVAPGVFVRATLQIAASTPGAEIPALPVEPADSVTDMEGAFELRLDPGVWRFEYTPAAGEELPLSSRLITIRATVDAEGQKLPTQSLSTVDLSWGRTVTGTVTGAVSQVAGKGLQYAQLRFFRVTTVEGRASSILLGTTIADDRGKYRLVLPTVTAPADGSR